VTHFAGIKENGKATLEFDETTSTKGESREIHAQIRE
jgi:hypothetical protein